MLPAGMEVEMNEAVEPKDGLAGREVSTADGTLKWNGKHVKDATWEGSL